jgi:hypothetical protein
VQECVVAAVGHHQEAAVLQQAVMVAVVEQQVVAEADHPHLLIEDHPLMVELAAHVTAQAIQNPPMEEPEDHLPQRQGCLGRVDLKPEELQVLIVRLL